MQSCRQLNIGYKEDGYSDPRVGTRKRSQMWPNGKSGEEDCSFRRRGAVTLSSGNNQNSGKTTIMLF
jgi:hypothetical protein